MDLMTRPSPCLVLLVVSVVSKGSEALNPQCNCLHQCGNFRRQICRFEADL